MAHNTVLPTSDAGGNTVITVDLALNTYPTGSNQLPASCLYVSPDATTAPTPVTDANPLPVDGTVTANLGATDNAVLDAIAASVAGTLTVGSHAVTVSGDALTALQLIDDAVYADDVPFTAGSNKVMAAGFRFDDTVPDGVTEGDVGYARMSSTRSLHTVIRDAAGNERGLNIDASGQIAVTGTFWQATQPVSGTVTANAGTGTFTVSGAVTNTVLSVVGGGTEATAQRVTIASDSTGVLSVDDNGGSLTVDGTVNATLGAETTKVIGTINIAAGQNISAVGTVTTVTTVSQMLGSTIAHDVADAGSKPHKIGARAVASVSAQTLVAADDRTDLFAGLDGVLITRPHCNLEDIVTATPVAITDGSSTSVLASPGAGLRNYITSIAISNSSSTFVTVDLRDGTAGAVLWTIPVPATGGVVYTFPVPLKFTAATAVAADPSAAASTITVSVLGFKSKV